ncbi:hypothetical protein NEMIN01_0272 [Nematocida minor]|uniref:uncharacterized protein n=1 Tax=Nematocida minor TaxID=1912983 RepID=UPI00221EF434|nr:uncharacterized protein NEMIN01_0272 [Nematocida minor]KAI5189106.1 hypothetical protein NEMIN01_0272 [Nematocida minor]
MKKQELRRILGTGAVLLSLLATKSREGWCTFDKEAVQGDSLYRDSSALMSELDDMEMSSFLGIPADSPYQAGSSASGVDEMSYQFEQPAQYMAGPMPSDTPFDQTYSMPSTSHGQYRPMDGNNNLHFSSAVQAPLDDAFYNGYNHHNFSTVDGGYQYSQSAQFLEEPGVDESVFIQPHYDMPSTSRETAPVDQMGNSDFASNGSMHNPVWDGYTPFEEHWGMAEQDGQLDQKTAEFGSDGFQGSNRENDVIIGLYVDKDDIKKEVEAISSANDSPTPLDELVGESSKKHSRPSAPQKKKRKAEPMDASALQCSPENIKRRKKKEIDEINIKIWDESKRLANRRRRSSRLNHRTIYTHHSSSSSYINWNMRSDEAQESIEKSIMDFSVKIAPLLKNTAIWYFIATLSTCIYTKYKDLLWLLAMFKSRKNIEYKEIVESFGGSYPGLIEDVTDYVVRNEPKRCSRSAPTNEWEETLGDIYMREYKPLNYYVEEKQKELGQTDKAYRALAYALHMIVMIPEVHQDFSNITEEFIRETNITEKEHKNKCIKIVLLGIYRLVNMDIFGKEDLTVYGDIYSALRNIYGGSVLKDPTAIDLYREIYVVLAEFYEKAIMFDKTNEYVLVGKCIITNQKYIKCEKVVNLAAKSGEKRVSNCSYSVEENMWSLSSAIKTHYYVRYVDSIKNTMRMLCMPVYENKKKQEYFYLHTIDEIIEHIKALHQIEVTSNAVHPFKVRKGTRKWSYIKKEERMLTVEGLKEYEVVFYRMEENTGKEKFAFAEFWPLIMDSGICIPLFLTPLMQSAVELGPFVSMWKNTQISSIEFENRMPDSYEYNNEYGGQEYSDIHDYYSNLWIPNKQEKIIDSYIMNCQMTLQEDNTLKAVWYVRMPGSIDAYTHCILDDTFKGKEKFNSFTAAVESRTYNKGSDLQGFWLHSNYKLDSRCEKHTQLLNIWITSTDSVRTLAKKTLKQLNIEVAKTKERLEGIEECQILTGPIDLKNDEKEEILQKKSLIASKSAANSKMASLTREIYIKHSKRPEYPETEFIVFRNTNHSKSNLHAHNELLDVLISRYNR